MELERISIQSAASTMESSSHPSDERQDPFPLYSSDISFLADSYWGSDAYHHHIQRSTLPQPAGIATDLSLSSFSSFPISVTATPPSPPLFSSSSRGTIRPVELTKRWLVGDLVYIPAAQWFEPKRLFRYPHAEKMFLTARIIKRTPKQVTLQVPALGRDLTRGFGFMEVCPTVCFPLNALPLLSLYSAF
jgi:hypothetical protein